MNRRRALVMTAAVLALFACKRERASKNDDILACNASGGQWVEGGCSNNGRCERPAGMAPNDDDDDDDDDDVYGEKEGDDD